VAFLSFALGAARRSGPPLFRKRRGRSPRAVSAASRDAIGSDGERAETEFGSPGMVPRRDAQWSLRLGGPLPVLRASTLWRGRPRLDFRGVLDRGRRRAHEVGEHVVARPWRPGPQKVSNPASFSQADAHASRASISSSRKADGD